MLAAALVIVGMFAAGFGGFALMLVGLSRASRKGYQGGTILAVLIAALLVGFGFFFAVTESLAGGIVAVLAPISILGPPAIALLLLPRRKPRRIFSVRRVSFPYARIGQAFFIIGCLAGLVLSLLSWWYGEPVWLALVILPLGPIFGVLAKTTFTVFGQPERAVPSFADVLAADPRPPVVFMRAFERESQTFVNGSVKKYGRYTVGLPVGGNQTGVLITLDEYLSRPIRHRIGPFLALGNPQDYFTPAGAVRAYFKDDTWMDEFRELAERAVCLLVEAGESTNLRWELQYLRQSNLHEKLVVITNHPTNPDGSPWAQLGSRVAGVPQVSWDRFAAMLNELSYQVPADEPEFGSVLGFDADARALVLTSDADLPEEFVEPMAAWLAAHRDAGRCAEATCTTCGRHVFKRPEALDTPFVCRTCRAETPYKQVIKDVVGWVGTTLFLAALVVGSMVPSMLGFEAAWVTYAWLGLLVLGPLFLWGIYKGFRS